MAQTNRMFGGSLVLAAACLAGTLWPAGAGLAQEPAAASAPPAEGAPAAPDKPPFTQEELDQMLAPIALYPDSLISQILMASTYPLEIVQAARWAKENAALKGDALATELEKQTWDPSVRSLVNFPDVLSVLNEKLDNTVKIGDAFLGQQKQVMDSIQGLRHKAQDAGNLKSSEQQKVIVESSSIVIEPASPEVIYVPQYDPVVVYGSWPYPAYPPYYYYPPHPHPVAGAALAFGVGVACGAAWGYAWGHCGWGHGDIDINVNRNVNLNRNINRSSFQANYNKVGGSGGGWKHDPAHREGAAYRNQSTASRVGGTSATRNSPSRDAFKGRSDSPARPSSGSLGHDGAGPRNTGGGDRPAGRAESSGAHGGLGGADRGGAAAHQESQRGSASRGGGGGARPAGGGGRRGR